MVLFISYLIEVFSILVPTFYLLAKSLAEIACMSRFMYE